MAAEDKKPAPSSRTPEQQKLYDEIKSQVLKDLVEERKKRLAAEESSVEYIDFTPSLPPFATEIRLDGRIYTDGFTYKVRADALPSLLDIQGRAWTHEAEVRGTQSVYNAYRPHQVRTINSRSLKVT